MRSATIIMGAVAISVCLVAAALVISNDHSESPTRAAMNSPPENAAHAAPAAPAVAPPTMSLSSLTACGPSVSVGPHVSCSFGVNVVRAYHQSGDSSKISAYSPVTKKTYTMSCQGTAPAICNGGENATVYVAP